MTGRENGRVYLLANLDGIAAIDEDGAAVQHQNGKPPGAGKTGEPAQPFGIGRHIFALEFILAGNDETVEIAALELVAQARHALRREMTFGDVVK